MITIDKKLQKIKVLDKSIYENIDIDRLTLYGFYVLEKNKIPLYFDYVVVGLLFLFPEKFSMETFKKYPDTNRVKNAINRMAGKFGTHHTSRKWLVGSVENGFTINDSGYEVIEQVKYYFKNPNIKPLKKNKRKRGKIADQLINEIIESNLYKSWEFRENIEKHQIYNFFKIIETSDKKIIKTKFEKMLSVLESSEDENIKKFLTFLKKSVENIIKNV